MPTDHPKRARGFGLAVERFGPTVISLIVLALLIGFRSHLLQQLATQNVQPTNLYGAVFNWSAIQVGFAFGVYGFILAKNDGFVGAMRKSIAMERFVVYVRRGTIGGFLLTIASVPIAVVSPSPSSSSWTFYILAAWFSLFVWTFLAFIRIAFGFGRLSSVPDKEPFYGA